MQHLLIVETILRDRAQFFAEIRDSADLPHKIRAMLLSSFTFLAIYGAIMGLSSSLPQAASSFVKLPVLFLATLLICAPSLYILNIMFGSRQSLMQNVAFILTAICTSSVLLVSFAPITLFFLITTSEYQFFKLLNVAFFVVAGGVGLLFLWRALRIFESWDHEEGRTVRRGIFYVWALLYGFVGSQMAWALRPFMGIPGYEFILLEQRGGNFYADVFESLRILLGFAQ